MHTWKIINLLDYNIIYQNCQWNYKIILHFVDICYIMQTNMKTQYQGEDYPFPSVEAMNAARSFVPQAGWFLREVSGITTTPAPPKEGNFFVSIMLHKYLPPTNHHYKTNKNGINFNNPL